MITHVYAMGVGAVLSALITWQLSSGHYLSQLQTERLDYQRSKFAALEQAASETARMQKAKDDAIAKAVKRQNDLARDADNARRELDRLQDAARSTASRSANTCPAAAHDTSALSWVLGKCAAELQDVAAKADGHVSDIRTLMEAWPK